MILQWFIFVGYHLLCEAYLQSNNPRIVEHPESVHVAENEPATLNCVAKGTPSPIITWYRNGRPVVTANEDQKSHRMVLPSGQLFFLRVTTNKTHQVDVGVYYCNATNPETNASVISKNATLEIAVLGSDFQLQPKDVEVALGMTAILECKAPWGKPEPKVKWKKDGEPVKGDRIEVLDVGTLKIRDVRKDDAGMYTCSALNSGGQRDSQPVMLSVREKPRIVEGPKDALVQENSDVSFHCRATGDPEPLIIWKKVEDAMPQGRLHIMQDKSLKIERTQLSDNGIYVCKAENIVGSQEAEAKLTVHSQPSFLVTPRDKTVGVGKRVTFKCSVTGNPTPAVFWNKETSKLLMFPQQDYGRMSVSDDGTLIIENVEKSDAGNYVCKGLSVAGNAYVKARLDVKDFDTRPPPIINHAPQNQTLPANSVAMMHCTATGDPPPSIKWLKNGRLLNSKDERYIFHDSGTLQINDLRKSDSGIYSCRAVSETGEASKTCTLQVEVHTNPSIIFHRTPEPSTFPGPPSKPVISDVSETSTRLTWRNNPNQGSSPVFAYTVEYFSHETGDGWIVASDSVNEQTYVVRGLKPDTSYMFLVRAQNSHGLSLPSHVTAPIKTKGSSLLTSKPVLSSSELELVEDKLSTQIISMHPAEVLGSTAVKLTWEIRRNHRFIEGFHIRYKILPELNDHVMDRNTEGSSNYSVVTIPTSSVGMYTLHNLKECTWYEIDMQPFYRDVIGHLSNSIRVRTLEDVPSATPQNIRARMVHNNTLYISWEPPPKQHYNGFLKGYKIYIFGNESKFDKEILMNSSLEAVYIQNMIQDMAYKIQMSAFNKIGEGLRSEPILIGPITNVASQNVTKQAWFVVIIIIVGLFLWAFFCILSIWLVRRNKKCKNATTVCAVPKYSTGNSFNTNNWSVFSAGNYSVMSQSKEDANSHNNLSSGKNVSNSAEPYLTSSITPCIIKQQYMIEPKIDQSFFSSQNSPGNYENKLLEESVQYEQIPDDLSDCHPALYIPPPPEHPPPPSNPATPRDSLNLNWNSSTKSYPYYSAAGLDFEVEQNSFNRSVQIPVGSALVASSKLSNRKLLAKEEVYLNGSNGTNPRKYMLPYIGMHSSQQNQHLPHPPANIHLLQNDSAQLTSSLNSPLSEVAVVDSESESDANLSQVCSPLTSDVDAQGNWGDEMVNSESFSSMGSSENECLGECPAMASRCNRLPETAALDNNCSHKHPGKEKCKKLAKSKQKVRCFSPCSTDSNYSSIPCKTHYKSADKRMKTFNVTSNFLHGNLPSHNISSQSYTKRFDETSAYSARKTEAAVAGTDKIGGASDEPSSSNDSSSCQLLVKNTTCAMSN